MIFKSGKEKTVPHTKKHAMDSRPHEETRGGGDGGNMIEARVAKLEAHVENVIIHLSELRLDIRELRKDNKWLIGLMIIMLGAMAKGFHWI